MNKPKRSVKQSRGSGFEASSHGGGAGSLSDVRTGTTTESDPGASLVDMEERLAELLESLEDAYFLHDGDGRVLDANGPACTALGYARDRLLELRLTDFQEDSSSRRVTDIWREIPQGATARFKGLHVRQDGSAYPVSVRVRRSPSGDGQLYTSVARDLSEFDHMQERLLQAEKLESIGRLAGGLAHDFGNMLTPVLTYSELVSRALDPKHELQAYLQEIQRAGERAADLAHRVLSFSRQQTIEPKALNLNELILSTTNMLRRLVGEDIEIVTLLGRDLHMVSVDPGQMQQILVNLAVNARDAMPQGGQLTIESANIELAGAGDERHHVALKVQDTGVGMADDVKGRLFQPFFTTKEQGRGTGLGLSTCYSIVRQNGGDIAVESAPGMGSTFTVYLPAVDSPASEPDNQTKRRRLPRGNETVLLVDDTMVVRESTSRILKEQGYVPLEASNGQEALSLIEGRPTEPIHLLLTDVVMPLMGGRDLALRLAATHPETKVLYFSGYPDEDIVRHGISAAETPVMLKPLTPDTLARKIREVLDQT